MPSICPPYGEHVPQAKGHIALCPLSPTNRYHYKLDEGGLQGLLEGRFPVLTPSFIDTGRSTHVRHLLKYKVVHAPKGAALQARA